MEAGFVFSGLGPLPTQLHPVLHQVQRLDKDCSSHPERKRGGGGLQSMGMCFTCDHSSLTVSCYKGLGLA